MQIRKGLVVGSTVKRSCPKCRTYLKIALLDGVEVDTCPSCRGIWVDRIEERELLDLKPQLFTLDELRRIRSVYQSTVQEHVVRYVPCPVCGQLMNRLNWGTYSNVIVDRCRDHGDWYDAGELEKIREFIVAGGSEYEKFRVLERGLEEVSSKLIRETTRLDEKINGAYRKARLYSMVGL